MLSHNEGRDQKVSPLSELQMDLGSEDRNIQFTFWLENNLLDLKRSHFL